MKRPTEGNTYTARWEKTPRGYVAWLTKRPKEKVLGKSEDELKEQLWELALDHFGDGDACIELVPPLPAAKSGAGYFDPPWFKLSSNESFRNVGDRTPLYAKGLCAFCKTGLGGRTDEPRTIEDAPRSDYAFVQWENPGAWIVTEAFVDFFGPLLGKAMRTLPCATLKPARKKFLELVLHGKLDLVNHRKGEMAKGVVCPKCKAARYSFFVCEKIKKGMTYAVSRPALAAVTGPAHVLAVPSWPRIIVDEATAARLRKSKLKGVLLERLALLPADEVAAFPLRKLTKQDV